MPAHPIRIGLISDTHGLLRPEAKAFLSGSTHILHAGDIGHPEILTELQALAPLTAVRGNNDQGAWAERLATRERLHIGATCVYIVHDLAELDIDPEAAGVHVVVSGHSHKPGAAIRAGVLYINPGSAGPRRFTLPIAVAELRVKGTAITHRIVDLTTAVKPIVRRT